LIDEDAEVKRMNKTKTVAFTVLCTATIVVGIAAIIGLALSGPQASDRFLDREDARNLAIDYALRSHPELSGVKAATLWEAQDLTPLGLVGASKWQYVGEGWTVTVSYAVVQHPTYTLEIQYSGEISFSWSGSVDQAGNVAESEYQLFLVR